MSVFSGDTPKYFYEARDIKRASATKPVVQEEQPKSEEKGQNLLEKMANSHKYILESQISESEFSKLTSEQDHISIGQPAMHIVANQERVHEKEIHSMDTKPFEIISSEKDTLPDFIDFRKQIYIPIDSVNLKNPVAKNFYTTYQKVINDLPSTLKEVLKNENNIFLDEEFRPLPYSIIENIRNLDYKAERRLEWRRAMYLNPKQRIDIWSPTLKLPIKLETNLPAAHRLAKLFEALINKQLLQEVYIGGSITDGKHEFSLHNQAGVEVRVTIDDFLPASIESGISHPAYIRPVEVSGSLYILSSLLEKAMAKMFGAYSLLHQAPLAAVCQCLFGHDSVIDTHEIKIDSSLSDIANSHGGQGRKALLLACRQDEVEVKLLEQDWSPAEIDRWLLAVRNLYDIKMLIGLEGSPLGTKLASHLFTESSSGLSFKINDNSSLSINLRLAQTKTDGSNNSLTHIEILSQLTLEVKRSWILSSEELGWKDISGLPAGEYILLCRFESFELIVDFYGQADISVEPVSATEYEKIRRGQIRKLLETKLPSTSVLTPIEIDSRHSESDASFRIGNFDKISGKLIKVDGVVNINDWMAEVNGRVVNSVAEKTYIVLTGLEEEFLRLFAKKRDQKSAGIKLIFK